MALVNSLIFIAAALAASVVAWLALARPADFYRIARRLPFVVLVGTLGFGLERIALEGDGGIAEIVERTGIAFYALVGWTICAWLMRKSHDDEMAARRNADDRLL